MGSSSSRSSTRAASRRKTRSSRSSSAARERRVPRCQQQEIGVRLRLVAKAVRAELRHPFGHAADRERSEPTEDAEQREDGAEGRRKDERRNREDKAKQNRQAPLPFRSADIEIDRVARIAVEARPWIREQEEIRVEVHVVAGEAREESVHVRLKPTREDRREPLERNESGDPICPESRPHVVRDGEEQTEADGKARTPQIVRDDKKDGSSEVEG